MAQKSGTLCAQPGRKPGTLGNAHRGEMTDEQWEYIKAVEIYKKQYYKRFLAVTDYLEVALRLGYKKELNEGGDAFVLDKNNIVD